MNERRTSYIRLFHASPGAPAVDVYANGETLLGEGLEFGEFTPYIPVRPGEYEIDVVLSDNPEQIVLSTVLDVPEREIYTVAVIGTVPDLEAFVIEDPVQRIPNSRLGLRFVHLSPNAPSVDIALPTGDIIFQDVAYKDIPDYLYVEPDTYSIQVFPTGTEDLVLQVPNMKLKKDRFYTVYAIGLVDDEPPLQVVIPLDGNSYINL
ncbi:uncharacterized protein DUF4397 [Natranaerovirga hydrolytica]|uniref:Uncharacterized protein DUF4397 n=1 Tax=Natranaerovirga hydrolytica TaxID=680378 RepID=A0A4R1MJ63_9FIRM|nr:DUF4397 domain-containing protein [Natranaerovirga hydrolytica]TCK92455.1 uncharacterized protein DUF4397 [Natranaerovirga hydrolytica]